MQTAVPPRKASALPSWWNRQIRWLRSHPAGALRYGLQALFVAILARLAYVHRIWEAADKAGPSTGASIDALCPLGGFETFWSWVTTGSLLAHIHESALIMGLALVIAVVLAGPAFCGWVCPFGAVQEWLFKLGHMLPWLRRGRQPLKLELPGAWEKRARLLRYVVLALVLGGTWYAGSLVFQSYDPYRALFNLGSSEIALGAWIVLGLTLLGSLFIERFWCRYLCPLGALTGLLAKLGLTRIRREPAACTNCDLCTKACYANIPVAKVATVADTACTGCISCVEACPREGALQVEMPLIGRLTGSRNQPELVAAGTTALPVAAALASQPRPRAGKPSRWPGLVYGLAVPAVLLVTIGIASALGAWQTVGSTEVTVDQQSGVPSIDNIKGWRTPQEVSDMFGIPLADLYAGLNWPADFPADSPLKNLEEQVPDFSVTQVRDWVTAELAKKGVTVPAASEANSGESGSGKGERN